MGRRLPTIQLNRRQFVLGAAAVGLASCGPVTNDSDAGTAGADSGTPADAGTPAMCPGTNRVAVDTALLPADFVADPPKYFGRALAYVVRDAAGLYALSAICTHQNCSVQPSNGHFLCPCHQSMFALDGTVVQGPASIPLAHFALCLSDTGTVLIDNAQVVDRAVRLAG
jgi:Rieske Fe-S protein